jgi:hypothetical protein
MRLQFANNASTLLADPVSNSATECSLASGGGAEFPTLASDQAFYATFIDAATGLNTEIVLVTGIEGDNITSMLRGQDGTTAQAWLAGDHFEMLCNAATMREIGAGTLIGIQIFNEPGAFDYTRTAGAARIVSKLAGGGGAGGGVPVTSDIAGYSAIGGSGAAGAVVTGQFELGDTESIAGVIGAGGAGVAGEAGGDGGESSLGALQAAAGGGGGPVGVNTAASGYAVQGGAPGSTPRTGGNITAIVGGVGTPGLSLAQGIYGGNGGDSAIGPGAEPVAVAVGNNGAPGSNADPASYGAGGGGAVNGRDQLARAGGNGAGGVCIIFEYA